MDITNEQPPVQEKQLAPEDQATMGQAQAQLEEMMRRTARPLIEENNKAIVAEVRKALSEFSTKIPNIKEEVTKCLREIIEEERSQQTNTAAAVEQPVAEPPATGAPAAGRDAGIAGLLQYIAPLLGIGKSDGMGAMGQFFKQMSEFNSFLDSMVASRNQSWLSGAQSTATVMKASLSAGGDPVKAADSFIDSITPAKTKDMTAADAAAKISLNGH